MPMYDYRCATCGRKEERVLKIAELDQIQSCSNCGFAMNRLISAPYVRGDYAPYQCPVTGKLIEGRVAHENNLKLHNCRIYEPGETAAATRYRARAEEEFDKKIEATADELIYNLPGDKKDKLAAEMEAGVTVDIVRTAPN